MKIIKSIIFLLFLLSLLPFQSCRHKRKDTAKPDNIILMIGDGMGVSHIYAALTASRGNLNLEKFPYTGFQKTYSASNYITDSGASATAMATGQKTYNGAIGVDTLRTELINIVEYAEAAGMYTGLLATSTITHATPAAFAAHNKDRGAYEEIALDFLDSGLELFIGGGRSYFLYRKDGRNLIRELEAEGYFVGNEIGDLENKSSLPAAILTDSLAMPPAHLGRGNLLPEAAEMGLRMLSQDGNGFFMMIEASQIDWASHGNDTRYLISEMLDFDKAIGIAYDFAMQKGNTLVIVTADHETGGFAVKSGNFDTGEVTGDFITDSHTGVMVPVFAFGPGASHFSGIYDNTAIFDKMKYLLDL